MKKLLIFIVCYHAERFIESVRDRIPARVFSPAVRDARPALKQLLEDAERMSETIVSEMR